MNGLIFFKVTKNFCISTFSITREKSNDINGKKRMGSKLMKLESEG